MPLKRLKVNSAQARKIQDRMRSKFRLDPDADPIRKWYITCRKGTSNKYHYFALWKDDSGYYIATNASGRIGKVGRVSLIARTKKKNTALGKLKAKMESKMKKGRRGGTYKRTKMASVECPTCLCKARFSWY